MMKQSTVRIEKFFGLRSDVAPERMSVGDLIEALNVRLDESGRPVRRGGRSAPVLSNATHSLWGDGEVAFGVIGGVLSRIHPDYTTTPLVSGIASVRTNYLRLNERVYWSNGLQSGVIEHDANRSWGLEVPAMIQARPSSGQLPAGRYQYTLVYMRADGQESGAGPSNVIELPADSGLAIVAPAVPSGVIDVTHAVLYLSKAGGETLYRALEIAVGTAGEYRGDGSDLVHPLQTQFLSPPVPADALAWFAGRIWLGVGDMVLPSAAFSPELFDLRAYLPVRGNVTMLAPLANHAGMFVGTDTHTFFLSGADPEAMTLLEKQADGGIAGALVYVPGKFFGKEGSADHDIPVWASPKGLYAGLADGTVVSLTQDRYPLQLASRGAGYFDTDLSQVVFSAI
jgi:hypothetical protein